MVKKQQRAVFFFGTIIYIILTLFLYEIYDETMKEREKSGKMK
jgi:hypothetical protein